MKLELKHIAPYLPCGLDAINKDNKQMAIMGCLDEQTVVAVNNGCLRGYNLKYVKPILRPLYSMTKEEAKEFMMLGLSYCMKGDSTLLDFEIKTDKVSGTTISCSISDVVFNHIHTINTYSICVCGDFIKVMDKETGRAISVNYSLYEWLFENHFDVFGLINNALAIDKTKM